MPEPLFLLFYRSKGESAAERAVDAARAAALRDTVARARAAGFERILLATTDPRPFTTVPGLEIQVDEGDAPFAVRLRDLLAQLRPASLCYAGGGMPGFRPTHWRELRERLEAGESWTNNLYSSDVLATPLVDELTTIPDALTDNGLALHLRDSAGAEIGVLPRSAATLFDIDTPADLRVLARCADLATIDLGPDLRASLQSCPAWVLDAPSDLDQALALFTTRETEVLVVGRVASTVWQALESETACRVRVISEERGLRARPGQQARSLLGFHLDAVGPRNLIDALGELGDAVFLDTRPLFGHLGWRPSRADRFRSDAGDWEAIEHDDLREFTRAAGESRVPIVLGGHSLVSGGLLAAIDLAWSRWERAQDR